MDDRKFELVSPFRPTGDQPKAIAELVAGLHAGKKEQVLEGATGTGKTFTMANIIAQMNRPTLVFSHNKTLAGQLYSEFKELFPHNRVEFFVSNFDYYQPEAYMPKSDMYIEKTAAINEELDMFRESTLNSLLERRDTIVVASVACIYAASDPVEYKNMFYTIRVGESIDRNDLMRRLIELQYSRNDVDQTRGTIRVRGDIIDLTPSYTNEFNIRIEMFGEEIERITEIDPLTGKTMNAYQFYNIFPASGYARSKETMLRACDAIEAELEDRLEYFRQKGKPLEAERLEQRTRFDLEALRENGYCSGIENYSMHIDGRKVGQRPWNLFDYFPKDFLLFVDESHVSLPQVRGMYNGDRQRKEVLVEYGFRLPSAWDNRPLRFEEFERLAPQTIYVSATPGPYELEKSGAEIIDQVVRPTGLLDPQIEIRPVSIQVDDLLSEARQRADKNERVLVTTLTKKMAEDLTDYLDEHGIRVRYLHSDIDTVERVEIIRDLRLGEFDVLVGINLLREGLDIPEVSLVAILDADKEGFLRSERSLIQTIGRAARNLNGKAILYADSITKSMEKAITETNRRREKQTKYNEEHGIVPQALNKKVGELLDIGQGANQKAKANKQRGKMAAEPTALYNAPKNAKEYQQQIKKLEQQMYKFAQDLEFEKAAAIRDQLHQLREQFVFDN